jgi:hypothetical protein
MSQATLNGTLTDDGGEACTCQFYYGTDPDMDVYTTVDAVGALTTGQQFFVAITGLDPDTIYYFQSVATNSAGTSPGAILSFATPGLIAILGTPNVSGIGRYNATLGCSLINDGGEACALGFIWGVDPNDGSPVDEDDLTASITVVSAGRSPLDFSFDNNSFQPDIIYYFAAFANNSNGTIYSQIISFQTDPALQTIITPPPHGPPIFPPPTNPIINFANIGLAVGGTAAAMTLLFPSDDDEKKKKKKKKDNNNQLTEGKK